jgi:hypothetical protein
MSPKVLEEFDGRSLFVLHNCSLYLPSKWNQECFDAVYYCLDEAKIHHFVFLHATIGETHNFDFKYIAMFLHLSVSTPGMREPLHAHVKVRMYVVTNESNFARYQSNSRRTQNIDSVKPYDPIFDGAVSAFHIPY